MSPAHDDPKAWWKKSLADLSSTRIQLTYLVVGLFAYTVMKGIRLASNVTEIAVLLGTLTPVFVATLTYHMTGKWMEIKAAESNGSPKVPPS